MRAATMTADDIAAAFTAAVERRKDRRVEPVSRTPAEELRARLEGRPLPANDWSGPEFRPPRTLPEFLDERILEHGRFRTAVSAFLVGLAVAARDGEAPAIRFLPAARRLGRPDQAAVFANLGLWKTRHDAAGTGADDLMRRLVAEWRRLRLAEKARDDD